MTRKHFIMLAIELGDAWRDHDRLGESRSSDQHATAELVLESMERSIVSVCRRSNPNFDRDHFTNFVQEIRRGERDLDGKKVPASKRASVTA
jgi:hypothetical protein